jgi:hypothetical protein
MAISKFALALGFLAVIDCKQRPQVLFGDQFSDYD